MAQREQIAEMREGHEAQTRPLSLRMILRIYGTLGGYRWLIPTAGVCLVICLLADLQIIDEIRGLVDRDDLATAPLWTLAAPILLLCVLNRTFGWSQFVITVFATNKGMARLRNRFFDKLQLLSKSFYDRHRTGWLVARNTGDLEIVGDFMTYGFMMMTAFLTSIGTALVKIGTIAPVLLLPTVVIVPLAVATSTWYKRHISRAQRAARSQNSELVANMSENVKGVRVVQAFARENRNLHGFNRINLKSHNTELSVARLNALYIPAMDFMGVLNTTLVVAFGSWLIAHPGSPILARPLTPGDLVAYILYMNIILWPIRMLVELYSLALKAMASAERIFEIIDMPLDLEDPTTPTPITALRGRITFDDVSFRYTPGDPLVIDRLGLDIQPGETVALVGETGAGKTTIASLAARFYDVSSGRVLLDGVDVRKYGQEELHRHMGIIPQEGFLFDGPVWDNLRFTRPDMTDDDILAITRRIGVHATITALAHGYDTQIREGGASVSEGQRQVISIVRAFIADPDILILDEPTSSLDTLTESLIQSALEQIASDRTTLIIAHRLSTIRYADRIVVLDHGRIVEQGSHDDLMARGGAYAELVANSRA